MNSRKVPKDAWRIDGNNTALVVVDMQRAFVDKGAPLECAGARELVPKINQLAATCRELRIPVIFVRANRRADLSDSGLILNFSIRSQDDEMNHLEGMKGNEFAIGINVMKSDYIVHKVRYSAFIPGSSSLEPLLRGMGRDRFMICGVATDVCVGATTIDAMMLGFKVFFVGDLTATFTAERQRVALEVYNRHFAKVVTFSDVMEELTQLLKGREVLK